MKKTLLLLFACIIAVASFADDNNRAVKSSTEGGRYEIVQSELARKYTIKIDKYTGSTYQLVKGLNEKLLWESIDWLDNSNEDIEEGKINYQIFMGGFMAQDTYLINIYSGKTWQLCEDSKSKSYFWAPME